MLFFTCVRRENCCVKGGTLNILWQMYLDKYIYCLRDYTNFHFQLQCVRMCERKHMSFLNPVDGFMSFIHVILWLWGIQQCQILACTVHLTLTSVFPVLEYMNLDSGISESCLIVIPEELFSNTAVYCVPQDKLMHLFQLAFLKIIFIKIQFEISID